MKSLEEFALEWWYSLDDYVSINGNPSKCAVFVCSDFKSASNEDIIEAWRKCVGDDLEAEIENSIWDLPAPTFRPDAFCPHCDSYIVSSRVTNEETCDFCDTPVEWH